jgi:hypothetical protein
MHKRQLWLVWALIAVLVAFVPGAPLASAGWNASRLSDAFGLLGEGEGTGAELTVLSSTFDQLVLELTVRSFQLVETEIYGERHVVPSVAGLDIASKAGEPSLPRATALIGLPPSGEWSMQVVDAERETVRLSAPIAPAAEPYLLASPSTLATSDAPVVRRSPAYTNDALYPRASVSWGEPAWVRDLRVLPIEIYPFRYHPLRGELEYTRRMVVEVRFARPSAVAAAPASDVWEEVLGSSVINYDVAAAWQSVQVSAASASAANPLASTPGSLKVGVDADGMYELTYADLLASGFLAQDPDPRTVHLVSRGQEVALWVTGGGDGSFDPGDRLVFYGEAARTRFTGVNVYWLIDTGLAGSLMGERSVEPRGVYPDAAPHWTAVHAEENLIYEPNFAEANGDRWYWAELDHLQLDCQAVEAYTVQLGSVSPVAHTARLQVTAQGRTFSAHRLSVGVNNALVGDLVWHDLDRLEGTAAEISFDGSLLSPGVNTVYLQGGDCGSVDPNGMTLSAFDLSYRADHVAQGDVLDFWGDAGAWAYQVEGFSTASMLLFDITETMTPTRLIDWHPRWFSPFFALAFDDNAGAPRRYLALAQDALRTPRTIVLDTPSTLATSPGADYLLVGYGPFLGAAQPLLDLRATQAMTTLAIDVQDVYDEFSYGILDPQAIRDFLAYAYAGWAVRPSYVLLLGDGTVDYRDYLGQGWRSFVPVYPAAVEPSYGGMLLSETASDNRYVTVSGADVLPDILIGRLPVSSVEQAESTVHKIVDYEQQPAPGLWNRDVLFVADDADVAGDFALHSDQLYSGYTWTPYVPGRIYLSAAADDPYEYQSTDPQQVDAARQDLRARFDRGQLLVMYMGHSSHSQWALENLLHRDQVPALHNDGRLPVVLSMTCYTAAFHHLPYNPLDERLVTEAGGGAVGAWGPTGTGFLEGHYYLTRGFLDAMFAASGVRLGAGTLSGAVQLYGQDPLFHYMIDVYALLGDPAMAMHTDIGSTQSVYLPLVLRGY